KKPPWFLTIPKTVGQGTCIRVYLPTTADVPNESSPLTEQVAGSGEQILIVDDDRTVRQSTEFLLQSHHYRTLGADDGAAAIKLYTQHQDDISLIILDVMMPHMDGIHLVQRLKLINSRVKIIAISGLPANRDAVLAAGADAFFAKPYAIAPLLGTIAALVSSRPISPP
ncbi:MAG: response regulator, partial [Cyanobacteria bacterium J06559_3]